MVSATGGTKAKKKLVVNSRHFCRNVLTRETYSIHGRSRQGMAAMMTCRLTSSRVKYENAGTSMNPML